eukprot:1567075-Pyramimonas_sp.AAC.2
MAQRDDLSNDQGFACAVLKHCSSHRDIDLINEKTGLRSVCDNYSLVATERTNCARSSSLPTSSLFNTSAPLSPEALRNLWNTKRSQIISDSIPYAP